MTHAIYSSAIYIYMHIYMESDQCVGYSIIINNMFDHHAYVDLASTLTKITAQYIHYRVTECAREVMQTTSTYVHALHAHLFSSATCTRRLPCSVEEQPHCSEEVWRREGCTLTGQLTGSRGLTAIGTHWEHTTCTHNGRACSPSSPSSQVPMSSSSSSFALFELRSSLVSGPAVLLLDVSAGAEW